MYLKKGKIIRMRKHGEDWHEIVGSSPNIMGLRFLSLSLSHRFSFPLPFSFSLCLVTSIIVNQRPYRFCLRLSRYTDETGVILLAGEKARRDAGYVLANLPLRERRAVVDFFIPTPSTYAYIRATSATGIRFSLRRDEQ